MTTETAVRERPVRIQRKRTKGWKMPEGTVYVGRPGKWGNPYRIGSILGMNRTCTTMTEAVELYRVYMSKGSGCYLPACELRGKNLACWCKVIDESGNYVPCHADILLALANGMSHDEVRNENLKAHKRRTE